MAQSVSGRFLRFACFPRGRQGNVPVAANVRLMKSKAGRKNENGKHSE
ncbi:hypothetical protein CHCC20375_1805 [Bacillus licheniformis]|nr:hypothetical protein CHCC20375_1805 [Bacillus licheniformis]